MDATECTYTITHAAYEGSVHDALVSEICSALEDEEPGTCAALGVEEADAVYGENDRLDSMNVVVDDIAVEQEQGYVIGQVKSCREESVRGGRRKSVQQLDSFEQNIRTNGGTVTAKYRIVADLTGEELHAVEERLAREGAAVEVPCTVEAVERNASDGVAAFFETYDRDGKPVILVIVRRGFGRSRRATAPAPQRITCLPPQRERGAA